MASSRSIYPTFTSPTPPLTRLSICGSTNQLSNHVLYFMQPLVEILSCASATATVSYNSLTPTHFLQTITTHTTFSLLLNGLCEIYPKTLHTPLSCHDTNQAKTDTPSLYLPSPLHHLCLFLPQPTETLPQQHLCHIFHQFPYHVLPILSHVTSIGYTKPHVKPGQQIIIFYRDILIPYMG